MKKLLLALVITSVAAVSQAVVLNWTHASTDTWVTGVTGGALVWSETGTDVAAALAAAQAGVTTGDYLYASDTSAASNLWKPNSSGNARAVLSEEALTGIDDLASGTYFIVLFGDAGKSAVAQIAAADTANAWLESVGASTAGYTPVSGLTFTGTLVPEPTVLALLALGVAGLALRRKA